MTKILLFTVVSPLALFAQTGWKPVTAPFVSFRVPAAWELSANDTPAIKTIAAKPPGSKDTTFELEYHPGFRGTAETIFQENRAKLQQVVNAFNERTNDPFQQASLTYEGPHPDKLGGKSISFSLVFTGVAMDVWLNVVAYGSDYYVLRLMAPRAVWGQVEPIRQAIVASVNFVQSGAPLSASSGDVRPLIGSYTGRRGEKSPLDGRHLEAELSFDLREDGSYRQRVTVDGTALIDVTGKFEVRRAHDPANPSYTHMVAFTPGSFDHKPSLTESMVLAAMQLPDASHSEHWLSFNESGALTLKDVKGRNTWGLNRDR